MEKGLWWKKPMRVLQYNLQVKDTPGMDPEKIARETQEMSANVVVMNVGGIYAWYDSKVKYHHINEYLPKGRDLLEELIVAFHKRGIRFVARFDFSLTDDVTYLEKPQWFARHQDKSPCFRGEKRMGEWSLFLTTCPTGGYRNEEVAVPVLQEVLERYDIDGIFFNAPFASPCFCERCKKKYQELYGVPMPEKETDFDPGWLSRCTKDNMAVIYRAIKEKRAEVPVILYYNPYDGGGFPRDSIYDRMETADLICTESQDVLSRGVKRIPQRVHPVVAMKAGCDPDFDVLPFGIIHSCPGMDWRHVGLPSAEYLPWMCQIPAAKGTIWHSVTGYGDTISDKRILRTLAEADRMIEKVEGDMDGAVSRAEVLLLWDGKTGARCWAEALVRSHIQFDLMHDIRIVEKRMKQYSVVIAPEGSLLRPEIALAVQNYVKNGGSLLVETAEAQEAEQQSSLLGIEKEILTGEYLTASYLYFEDEGQKLKTGMDTDKIAFRGKTAYCTPKPRTEVLATLIPPFAPMDVVGAPPERASIPVPHTQIGLAFLSQFGKGQVLYLPFSLSGLIEDYHLSDHLSFLSNAVSILAGGERELEVKAPADVYTLLYENKGTFLVHFVNEVGERPLTDNIPILGISFRLRIGEKQVREVRSVIAGEQVEFHVENGWLFVTLRCLSVWDMISIKVE